MNLLPRMASFLALMACCEFMPAQNYKSDRQKEVVEVLDLQVSPEVLLPDTTVVLLAKDERTVHLRTNSMGDIEHIGIPLFTEMVRLLQPSPVYDFLEYAVLNWKYEINPDQLNLLKVIFKQGSWETLLQEKLNECECAIENKEDKLYVVTWKREDKELAVLGIPIEYELLSNNTRRNMERAFVSELERNNAPIDRQAPIAVSEESLSIYGTEGLFVIPGKSYIIDLLNQNIYYKLATVYETVDTIIGNKPVAMTMEAVLPVVVRDAEFPAETFANLLMCDDNSVPDITVDLKFHLSNYHYQQIILPLSQLKVFCNQQGCSLYFAYDGIQSGTARGVMFACNQQKGYNHLFSLRMPVEQLTADSPIVQADAYLYIPPIDKERLFGTSPAKKSNVNFKLP